ncbi:sarcosine oxidase subunit gamma [Jannaschia seohaensis]|uniref:Sarcosine oxidase subunit gamma n=1 Tax=Jannaschia seohaensis TaxID=475081 RepID=A0A2Y9AZ31_9RHOB|nr:sarcosine oxidase subunit gamma family protein [Jannaschia seohaensis]PWJ15846.1 sarcosine oxidase subunit gamma [Jannaschia seohaensis]SSA49550.1 sarcosine oxidase subunit gamma [Jannaschia seohaensis]
MSDITVSTPGPIGMITLRGAMEVLGSVVTKVTGCALPERRKFSVSGAYAALWMSPDELLLVCDHDEADEIAKRLTTELGAAFATVAVVSDARAVFDLAGPEAHRALAKLCPVDFPRLAENEVRRTRMAQVPAALWRHGEGWRVVCFRSVAGYAERLLTNAAA